MQTKGNSLFYNYYDSLFAEKDYAEETDLVLKLSQQFGIGAPHDILEIGCGTCNHTIDIARKVKHVTAIDIDSHMIQKAKEKIKINQAKNIKIIHNSIEKLKGGKFDLAIALFNVVTYIPDTSALFSFMGGVAKHLKLGGVFVFDCWNGIAALRNPPKSKTTKVKQKGKYIECLVSNSTDFFNQKVMLNYHISVENHDKQEEDFSFSQTLWTPMQIRDSIESAGMKVMRCFPLILPDRSADENDWKIMFVAKNSI